MLQLLYSAVGCGGSVVESENPFRSIQKETENVRGNGSDGFAAIWLRSVGMGLRYQKG